jgi:hypothetical protein
MASSALILALLPVTAGAQFHRLVASDVGKQAKTVELREDWRGTK